ncbi:hypothetical protein EPUS_07910 [Endocarpon pusillum Z07020]|uniref:FHA domain-containing protein n=1 Tax=Endocarpon pusillum (strain Z07020 / HMAS-L-300199) TaxID=1263415 RepID=U1GJV7_ENDPU|nr:uncharacterized protein EPUS_07910 [Endocarpon pusillum Z07020]ERF72453.1 hypothetical protein EPUS_07910 [Endocarpon pusillum Z07020]
MSSQVLAAPMVGHDLSRRTGTRSPAPSKSLDSPSALEISYDQQHSLHEQSHKTSTFLSHKNTNNPDTQTTHPHDQTTFEQTQRAVGNLLDALRTNVAQSHLTKDGTAHASSEVPEKLLHDPDLQRPSVSPLEPQSPGMSVPTFTGFTFPGAHALDDSLAVLPLDGLTASMADVSQPQEDLLLSTFADPQHASLLEGEMAETVEEELPLNVQNAQDTGQIAAYAKLEFDDGPFYITTHSLELGRDARAYRAAKARLAEQQRQQKGEGSSSGNSHPSSQNKRDGGSQVKGSVVSDRGGFYGVDDVEGEAQEAHEERQRQEADGPHSSNHSASSIVNPKDLYTQPPLPHFNYQAYPIEEYEREIEEIPAPLTSEHFPEQEEGFLLPIHHAPVKDDLEQDVANHRSVSRRHAKIFWEDDCFKIHIKGVNGAFVNEEHYPKDAIVPLREDVSIQIKGIKFQFKLPVHNSIESSDESDQVEDDSPNQNAESSSATSGVEDAVALNTSGRTPLKVKIRNFNRTSPPPVPPVLGPDGKPKRRGPGRPPKDGIMSKRERTAKERADREAAAKAANGGVTPEPSNRGRAGRTTAKAVPEVEDSKPAKRKYTKRKPATQDPDDVTPKLEEESEGIADDAPPTKRARVNRSESPEYPKLEDLSEKDLLRPPHNYSILIYDLLKESPKPLDLKGIYRGLKMKWPHFLYRYKDPKGWESSVRHNVNEDKLKIIEKVDRVGKGYSYRAKPGVDIEQHKKKRARSPPAAQKMSAPPQPRYPPQPQPPPPGPYTYPQSRQPPPGHGMYGHLVPTTVPQSSMAYTMTYPPATAGAYSSGAVASLPQYATSGPPAQQISDPTTTTKVTPGTQSLPITASATTYPAHPAAYPTPPTANQARPEAYSNSLHQQPPRPTNPILHPPPPTAPYQTPTQPPKTHSQPALPPPPPGVSPYQPFLPTGLSVISTFESSLLEGVENPTDLPRIRATLASVRKRVFEGANGSSLVGGETQDERTFLHYFRHILENERFRNPGFVGWEAVRREKERLTKMAPEGGAGAGVGAKGGGGAGAGAVAGVQAQAPASNPTNTMVELGGGSGGDEGEGTRGDQGSAEKDQHGHEHHGAAAVKKDAESEARKEQQHDDLHTAGKKDGDGGGGMREEEERVSANANAESVKEQEPEPEKEKAKEIEEQGTAAAL